MIEKGLYILHEVATETAGKYNPGITKALGTAVIIKLLTTIHNSAITFIKL